MENMGRGRDLGMLWLGTKGEKVEWLEECCTEYSMINGSSRELMRNSVLTFSASAEEDGDRTHGSVEKNSNSEVVQGEDR